MERHWDFNMQYKLKVDFPDVPAGEILELDDSNPGHPVYRSVNYPYFWVSANFIDTFQDIEVVKTEEEVLSELEDQKAQIESQISEVSIKANKGLK